MDECSRQEWEAICQRCGRCCYEKYEYRGRVFYSKTACPHLNLETRECRVYPQRTRHQPECAQLTPDLVRGGILPDDCPYVVRLSADE